MSKRGRQGWPSLVQRAQQEHPSLWDATLSSSTAFRAWRCMPVSQISSSNTRAFGFHFSLMNLAKAEARAGWVSYRLHLGSSVPPPDKEWGPASLQAACPAQRLLVTPRPLPTEATLPAKQPACAPGRSSGSCCSGAAAFAARLCCLALFRTLFRALRRQPGCPQQKALGPL